MVKIAETTKGSYIVELSEKEYKFLFSQGFQDKKEWYNNFTSEIYKLKLYIFHENALRRTASDASKGRNDFIFTSGIDGSDLLTFNAWIERPDRYKFLDRGRGIGEKGKKNIISAIERYRDTE